MIGSVGTVAVMQTHMGTVSGKWSFSQGNRKKPRIAPVRHLSATPRALNIDSNGDNLVWTGPQSWQEVPTLGT